MQQILSCKDIYLIEHIISLCYIIDETDCVIICLFIGIYFIQLNW